MDNRFIIVIGSRNNSQWVESNLGSVISQDYPNYKVMYYDDASADDTLEKVLKIRIDNPKVNIFESPTGKQLYKTWFFSRLEHYAEDLRDNDILVFLDGDDMFASENVLSYLNSVYNQTGCWMTYGGMRVWNGGEDIAEPFPQNSIIPDQVKAAKAYRKDTWRSSHLKSMRRFLWKAFDKKDLCPDGKYMVGPDDLAIMFAMLEMCPPEKVYRVTDPLYIYNHSEANQHSRAYTDHKEGKIDYESIVRSRKPYDTISFVTPTLAGGLGNQMFEIAAAASLAKDNEAVLIINNEEHILPNQGRNVNNYLDNIFSRIMVDKTIKPQNVYKREVCTYEPIPYRPNLKIMSHCQSWRYFDHNREYIRKLFGLDKHDHRAFGDVAVHLRRGDYYKFPDHHPQLPPKYFIDAVKLAKAKQVDIFTDDPNWCKENLDFGVPTFYDCPSPPNDWVELYRMMCYQNLIISNSSFGWWGAYLSRHPDVKIYVPSIWFGRAMIAEGFNIDDLVLPEWIKVQV